jgi:hypothetical protein
MTIGGVSPALRAGDPGPSLFVNNSDKWYRIRISDNFAPAGLVKFYDGDDKILDPDKPKATCISVDDACVLEPGKSLKAVILGSPKLQNAVVALYLSLDVVDKDNVTAKNPKEKSALRLHFVHGIQGSTIYSGADASKLLNKIGLSVPSGLAPKPVTIDKIISTRRFDAEPDDYTLGNDGKALVTVLANGN